MVVKLTQEQLDAPIEVLEYATRPGDSPLMEMEEEDITLRFVLEECASVKDTRKALNFGHIEYVRRLIGAGKIEGVKVDLGQYKKWYITQESIAYYAEHTLRAGKPKRYILRIFPEDEQQVREVLTAAAVHYELAVAYRKPKKPDNSLDLRRL